MSSSEPTGSVAGSDIRLREVLYLDRHRLSSYASQLYDGLTSLRRILGISQNTTVAASQYSEKEKSEAFKRGAAGDVGLIKAGLDKETTNREMEGFEDESKIGTVAESTSEDKTDFDNLLILVEQELLNRGVLQNFDPTIEQTGLVRFEGSAALYNFFAVKNFMYGAQEMGSIAIAALESINVDLEQAKSLASVYQAFNVGDLLLTMNVQGRSVISTLIPGSLYMTVEQMQSVYSSEDYFEATFIGFVPPKAEQHYRPGFMGMVNTSAMMKEVIGEFDLRVFPIALYTEL